MIADYHDIGIHITVKPFFEASDSEKARRHMERAMDLKDRHARALFDLETAAEGMLQHKSAIALQARYRGHFWRTKARKERAAAATVQIHWRYWAHKKVKARRMRLLYRGHQCDHTLIL